MSFVPRVRLLSAFAAACLLATVGQGRAQDISESHLKAARAAVAAIKATDEFDAILPSAAALLKKQLIERNPDLQDLIIRTVDEKTLALASRRIDLEKEAATSYARVFTEEQLNEIATFYNSPTGQKLISDGPIVLRELVKAAQIWQRGVARDLAAEVTEAIDPQVKQPAPDAPFPAPAVAPEQPAPAPN